FSGIHRFLIIGQAADVGYGAERHNPCHAALVSIVHTSQRRADCGIEDEKYKCGIKEAVQLLYAMGSRKNHARNKAQPEHRGIDCGHRVSQRDEAATYKPGSRECVKVAWKHLLDHFRIGIRRMESEVSNFVSSA